MIPVALRGRGGIGPPDSPTRPLLRQLKQVRGPKRPYETLYFVFSGFQLAVDGHAPEPAFVPESARGSSRFVCVMDGMLRHMWKEVVKHGPTVRGRERPSWQIVGVDPRCFLTTEEFLFVTL